MTIDRRDWGHGGDTMDQAAEAEPVNNPPVYRSIDDVPVGAIVPGSELARLMQQQVNVVPADTPVVPGLSDPGPAVMARLHLGTASFEENCAAAHTTAQRLEYEFATKHGISPSALNAAV